MTDNERTVQRGFTTPGPGSSGPLPPTVQQGFDAAGLGVYKSVGTTPLRVDMGTLQVAVCVDRDTVHWPLHPQWPNVPTELSRLRVIRALLQTALEYTDRAIGDATDKVTVQTLDGKQVR